MVNAVQKDGGIHTVLAAGVKGGDVVIIGSLVGIAVTDGDGSSLCAVATEGVYLVPKAAEAITQGEKLYWDSTNKVLTGTATANTYVGLAWSAQATTDPTVEVALANGI